MIGLTLDEIASLTSGQAYGQADVTGAATIDSRAVEPGGLFVAIAGENVDGHDFAAQALAAGAAAVLSTRQIEGPCVVVEDATVALGKIAREVLNHRDGITVIGITGSQGKTSVKDLLAQVLAPVGSTVSPIGSFNNELGVPLTVLRIDADTRFLIVEMGARGIGHIAALCEIARPDIGVVLNVGSAHLGEFGSADNIAIAKGELIEALGPGGTAVLNADDPRVIAMADRTDARVLSFGENTGDLVYGDVGLNRDGEPHFTLTHAGETVATSVHLIGAHHAVNAAAATAIGIAAGIRLADIATTLAAATAQSPMRMAKTVRDDGVVVINDAYNANPETVAAALRTLAALGAEGRTYAVLGEILELGESTSSAYHEIGQLAHDLGIDVVVAVGAGAAGIAEGAGEIGHLVDDVDAAVSFLTERLRASDVVIVKASRGCRLERVADALVGL